jgi:hypothetical protein
VLGNAIAAHAITFYDFSLATFSSPWILNIHAAILLHTHTCSRKGEGGMAALQKKKFVMGEIYWIFYYFVFHHPLDTALHCTLNWRVWPAIFISR